MRQRARGAQGSAEPASIEPVSITAISGPAALPSQPLWRFALIGLGPLTAMGIFALAVAFSQRVG
jgi:hypothetical protein